MKAWLKIKPGYIFGNCVAIEEAARRTNGRANYWLFECKICKQRIIAQKYSVMKVGRMACKCFVHRGAVGRPGSKSLNYRHGHASIISGPSPEYRSWVRMLYRCYNPNSNRYESYGGLGIGVCDRWHDFVNFLEDMGPRPSGMTLDRINVNRDYEPGNCRWADKWEQARNKWFRP